MPTANRPKPIPSNPNKEANGTPARQGWDSRVGRDDTIAASAPEEQAFSSGPASWNALAEGDSGITVNSNINHGRPTVAGTRIPVSRIVGYLSRHDLASLLRDFPALDQEKVDKAILYAVNLLGG